MATNIVRHPRSNGNRAVVLFVDDNLTQLDLYSMLLEQEFSVVKASRGETGYNLALAETPDAIVLDILLPDMDGLRLSQRLRAHPTTASVPIIALTADDGAYARADQMRSQFADVLFKPCPADTLIAAIRRAIG